MSIQMNTGTVKWTIFCVFVLCKIGLLYGAPIAVTTESTLTSGKPIIEDKNFTVKDAADFLTKYGYRNTSFNRGVVTEQSLIEAIKNLQKFAGLEITGILDELTRKLMATPRCQVADLNKSGNRYVAITKWRTNSLTYKLFNQPTKTINIQSPNNIQRILETSFNDWAKVTPLKFNSVATTANINLGFYSGNHGDDEPFDGPRGVLAHAFFPQDGRLHFDNAETWSDAVPTGTNFRQVATHELGHILGLGHSDVRSAVMFPYYVAYNPTFDLDNDDVAGIQRLYGKNAGGNPAVPTTTTTTTTTTTSTTTTTTQKPNACLGFYCVASKICISNSWVCDGDNDCRDNSDEINCQNPNPTTTTKKKKVPTATLR